MKGEKVGIYKADELSSVKLVYEDLNMRKEDIKMIFRICSFCLGVTEA